MSQRRSSPNSVRRCTTGELIESARAAVGELRRLVTASDSDAVRVSAARSVLEFGLKWHSLSQIEELAKEVAELKRKLDPPDSTPTTTPHAVPSSVAPLPTEATEDHDNTGPILDEEDS